MSPSRPPHVPLVSKLLDGNVELPSPGTLLTALGGGLSLLLHTTQAKNSTLVNKNTRNWSYPCLGSRKMGSGAVTRIEPSLDTAGRAFPLFSKCVGPAS